MQLAVDRTGRSSGQKGSSPPAPSSISTSPFGAASRVTTMMGVPALP
jgi:hypothetical protein